MYDKTAGEPLVLTLLKVHKERLATVGEGVYFACADFVTPTGKIYDLDIFMQGPDKDHLAVTEISVHKEAGKARYTWYEKGGIWSKKSVAHMEGSASKHHMAPEGEHPAEGSGMKSSETKHERGHEGSGMKGSETKEEHPQ